MDRRGTPIATTSDVPVVDPAAVSIARDAFAAWLRAEREARGVALEDIARVTKIHQRTLEKLEDAQFDQLPADVFVRGFIRNYARVVGLDAEAALQRYDDCGVTPGPAAGIRRATAMVQTVAAMAPRAARTVTAPPVARPSQQIVAQIVESVPVPESLASGSLAAMRLPPPEPEPVAAVPDEPKPAKKSKKRGGKGRGKKAKAVEAVELTFDDLAPEIEIIIEEPEPEKSEPVFVVPPPAFRPRVTGSKVTPIPTLVIDDADPESAEREREMRDQNSAKDETKRSFLPAALLDNERGRQGGLTLAVIILLIVATLTLSYLMRRPSAGGEGITLPRSSDAPSATLLV